MESNLAKKTKQKYPPRQSSEEKEIEQGVSKLKKNENDNMKTKVEDQEPKQDNHTDEDISLLIDNDSCNNSFSKDRREKFKSGLVTLLSRIRNTNSIDETTATDHLIPVENVENVTVEQMKRQKLLNFNSEYRNPAPQNVDVDSGVSETMEPSESSNWDDESNRDLLINTPQSPATYSDVVPSFDQSTLITICLKLDAIDDHLGYFNTVNSLILKKTVESMDEFENEVLLDRDYFLFLKTVRGALIHKILGEQMEDQVLETMMSICQNIDEILDPQFEVLFDINDSFCFEEWSEIFIENYSDKKNDSFSLLYVLDEFGNEISLPKREKSQPRLPIDLKVIDRANWTIDEPII